MPRQYVGSGANVPRVVTFDPRGHEAPARNVADPDNFEEKP
jgi:hypothetical protein